MKNYFLLLVLMMVFIGLSVISIIDIKTLLSILVLNILVFTSSFVIKKIFYKYKIQIPFYIFFVLITLMMAGLNSMLFFEYKLTFWEYLSLFIGSIIICISCNTI